MAYTQTVSVKKRIPWYKIGFFLIIVVGISVALIYAFGLGGLILSALGGAGLAVYNFFFGAPTWLSVVVTIAIVASIAIFLNYRRYFIRQKVTVAAPLGTTAPLQSQLQGSNALFNPVTTDVKQEENQT